MTEKKVFITNSGDLLEIQRASYYKFLFQDIEKELDILPNPMIFNPLVYPEWFVDPELLAEDQEKENEKLEWNQEVFLKLHEIKLKGPSYTFSESIRKEISYGIKILVKCYTRARKNYSSSSPFKQPILASLKKNFLISLKKNPKKIAFSTIRKNVKYSRTLFEKQKLLSFHDCFVAEIPLMTQDGTFYLNGCERVVISQKLRTPGATFKYDGPPHARSYVCNLYSTTGKNTYFSLEPNGSSLRDIHVQSDFFPAFDPFEPDLPLTTSLDLADLFHFFKVSPFELDASLDYPLFHDVFVHKKVYDIATFYLNRKKL